VLPRVRQTQFSQWVARHTSHAFAYHTPHPLAYSIESYPTATPTEASPAAGAGGHPRRTEPLGFTSRYPYQSRLVLLAAVLGRGVPTRSSIRATRLGYALATATGCPPGTPPVKALPNRATALRRLILVAVRRSLGLRLAGGVMIVA